jgi:S-adenosylmethionine hydrolase
MMRPLFLLTDFGWSGPYVGQLHASILAEQPAARVIDLMHDLPPMRPDLAASLVAAVTRELPRGSVLVAVVDPGVGGERRGLVVEAGGLTFVGPDNGLFARLPGIDRVSAIDWRPRRLSSSFHGRDLFAPVGARLAAGSCVATRPVPPQSWIGADWDPSLPRIVYLDGYGNAMTGIESQAIDNESKILVSGQSLGYAETFCRVPPLSLFWYRNSQGLVEIAQRDGSAAMSLSLALGDSILLH